MRKKIVAEASRDLRAVSKQRLSVGDGPAAIHEKAGRCRVKTGRFVAFMAGAGRRDMK